MVYARKVDSRILTFLVSGQLWRNSMVMEDLETHTTWSHVLGTALAGTLAGKELEVVPSVQTTWRRWRAGHPGTLLLKKGKAILSSHYQEYFDDPGRTGIFRSRWLTKKMPGKTLVYGIALGLHAAAVTPEALEREGLVRLTLGAVHMLVGRGGDGGVRAYRAADDGPLPELKSAAGGTAADTAGGRWNLSTGSCEAGPCRGRSLEEVPVHVAYWFAWSGFYPNTQVVE